MNKYLINIMLILLSSCSNNEEEAIRRAVNYQMEHYPQSTLQDLYKNFFQDVYGPGHLMKDTTAALDYLRQEIENVKGRSLHRIAEGTGYKNNFVRVDLYPVSTGEIPFYDFSLAFLDSAENFEIPNIEQWKDEWSKILAVIESMDLDLYNYEFDKKMIDSLLEKGEYAIHHSHRYADAYRPHYRLIQKEIFEERFGHLY